MIASLSRKIELKFWEVAIPVMSNSNLLKTIVQKTVQFFADEVRVRKLATCLVVSCMGFAAGILTYSFTLLLA